jgi:hypothetical protein
LRGLAATFTELLRFSPDARSSDDEPGNKTSRQKHVEAALDAFGQRHMTGRRQELSLLQQDQMAG